MTANRGPSFNVSQLKTFLECEQKGVYQYIQGRSPLRREVALDIGVLWHKLMEARLLGQSNDDCKDLVKEFFAQAFVSCEAEFYHKLRLQWEAIEPAFWAWKPNPDWQIIGVEVPLKRDLKGVLIEGRLDCLVSWNGQYWHLQHKTLAPSTPPDVYMAAMQRDWHECIYQWLAADYQPYGGTILNVVRKLSKITISRDPVKALWQIPIPRPQDQVDKAVKDMGEYYDTIAGLKRLPHLAIQNRSACAGRWGNRLCPYIGVCNGTASLTDDTLFQDTIDRYA